MANTAYAVKHTHTCQVDTFDTLDEALDALREVYGDDIEVDGTEDLDQSHGRALVWRDEADSVDDDGARAVASIRARRADV
jgi:hypothetical protein